MKRPKLGDEIEKPCSYIIHFDAPKAYRRGIFDLVGNYPVPNCDPFPLHDILYRDYGNSGAFEASSSPGAATVTPIGLICPLGTSIMASRRKML